MKIPLKLGQEGHQSSVQAEAKAIERDVIDAKNGDWNAKNRLVRTFHPLLVSLAQKRADVPAQQQKFIEAGKEGLFKAVRKHKAGTDIGRFRLFALDFIEAAMDRAAKGGGLFSRLFGGR